MNCLRVSRTSADVGYGKFIVVGLNLGWCGLFGNRRGAVNGLARASPSSHVDGADAAVT